MGNTIVLNHWEEDTGEVYTPDLDFSTVAHPSERLYRMASALIKLPGGKIEVLNEFDDDNPYKKTVPHKSLDGVKLVVRTGMRDHRLDPEPSNMICGVIRQTDGPDEESYIGIPHRRLRYIVAKAPAPFDEYLASFFDSHFAALSQEQRSV